MNYFNVIEFLIKEAVFCFLSYLNKELIPLPRFSILPVFAVPAPEAGSREKDFEVDSS